MTLNLLDTAKGYFTDAVISRVSSSLTENPEAIQKALTGALPVVIGSLIARSHTPDGPDTLTELSQELVTDQPTTDDPEALLARGDGISTALFGTGTSTISTTLARFAGIKDQSATSLLGMVGALCVGLLGRQFMGQGGNIPGGSLVSWLSSQRESVSAAMPAELAPLMGDTTDTSGLGNLLGGLSGAASSGVTGAASAVGSAMVGVSDTPPLPERPNRVASTPAYSDTLADQGKRTTVWPWVVAAAVVAGLLFFFLGGNETDTDTIATTNDTTAASVQDATAVLDSTATSTGPLVDSASTAISAAADSMAKALAASAAALGTFAPKKLPDGIELNIPANGIENKLIAFIDDPAKMVDQTTWFNFDRVQYETGSAKLKPESREQLQNIAAILKAYPAIALKVGGYTDNTGNAAANKTLSQSRAEAAVAELVRLGVDSARLEAEGYGQAHPVASNKTDEGRAQNRRTAVRVTKK